MVKESLESLCHEHLSNSYKATPANVRFNLVIYINSFLVSKPNQIIMPQFSLLPWFHPLTQYPYPSFLHLLLPWRATTLWKKHWKLQTFQSIWKVSTKIIKIIHVTFERFYDPNRLFLFVTFLKRSWYLFAMWNL